MRPVFLRRSSPCVCAHLRLAFVDVRRPPTAERASAGGRLPLGFVSWRALNDSVDSPIFHTPAMMPPVPPPRIVDVLAASLEAVFDALCTQRYGGPISLERVTLPDDAPSTTTARFRLHRVDLPELGIDFEVRHVGGNMYDVQSTIVNGPSQAFTYSLPDAEPRPALRAPRLASEVAAFLLDALERQVGSNLLRTEIGPSRPPSASGRSTPRSLLSS